MIDILLSAFLLSIVLLGIHSFFGIEIIRRGIIFTDLAIGQMAALGAAIAILFFDGNYMYIVSLLCALIGGISIAIASHRSHSHEAFIGLLYAFGIAAVFIILSKSPHGLEMFDRLMAADILFTPFSDILYTGILYSFVGFLLFFLYPHLNKQWGEFAFFILFAITVTSSVRLAGVLVVFSLLVAPAYIALRFAKKYPLLIAWLLGTVINLVAILASFYLDLPTGYTLVFAHAFVAISISILFPAQNKA